MFHKIIDDIHVIKISKGKTLNKKGIHITKTNPTMHDVEDALDFAFAKNLKNIFIHGEISEELQNEYNDFVDGPSFEVKENVFYVNFVKNPNIHNNTYINNVLDFKKV